MSSNKTQCAAFPEAPNGDTSRLFTGLLEKINGRPLVNYLYATYKANNVGAQMAPTYSKNSQGEHNVRDFLNFIDWKSLQKDISNLHIAELNEGFIDTNGQRIDYTNATEALEKANDFNTNHTGIVANVVQNGDVYHIIASEKNSKTHRYGDEVKGLLNIWEIYKQTLNTGGVDIESMPSELQNRFNALNSGLGQLLKNISNTTINNLYRKDALTLFMMSPNSPHVQRLVNAFGSLEDAAQAIDDHNHGIGSLTSGQQTLLQRAINDAKRFQGIDLDTLIARTKEVYDNTLALSTEEPIAVELHKLNKQYNIEINEIPIVKKKIETLSDAVAETTVLLKRQIAQLKRERGNNEEGKNLEQMLDNLLHELNAKRYCSGIFKFLENATNEIAKVDSIILDIPNIQGTELEKSFAIAKKLQEIKSIKTQFYPLVSALSNENLVIDETISQIDIDNLRQSAKDLKAIFDKKDKVINDYVESTMIDLMTSIIGEETPDGKSMYNAIKMASTDSSIFAYLYSVSRASNPIVAAMGSIIRNAQDERDAKLNAITLRNNRITDRLYNAGHTSEFIYEDDGHIISDIDWSAYNAAKVAKSNSLLHQGLRGFAHKQALEEWEDANTEDRIVDTTNNRTEKVPNYKYRKLKDFQEDWTDAQKEYYRDIMQLKGEIGSLLPAYAQHQYLPPQLRRNFLDAVSNAKNTRDVAKAIKNKVKDLYTVREDDQNYGYNGVISGDKYLFTEGDYNNTPLRQIPIFFINEVEQGELLKDFSSGIQALAGTAINYNAMSEIADVVEFIGDFAKDQASREKTPKAEVVQNKMIRVIKELYNRGTNANTASIIDGYIAQEIYGQRRDPNENKKLAKLFGNLIGYTSFKGLATNIKGAVSNYLVGEFQMLIEAGAGEFYGFKDYAWAHSKLFGGSGVGGELAELLTNNVNHKSVLFRELFDPIQENFSDKSSKRYHKSMFRQLVGHDCAFIGYSSGEYLIHYVNMYAVLHNQKVLLNGEKINLYDAFEVTNKQDNNSELKLKDGVTDLDGNAITDEFIDKVRKKIRYVNQSTHGSMNAEDKGILHQKWWGRGIMNFRQWMVEHYSRRFRGRHFDSSLGEDREGYWISFYKGLVNEDLKDLWKRGDKTDAIAMFLKDFCTFMFRAQSQWSNLDDMQKYNVKRVRSEVMMYFALLGLSFALGEPDEHKKEFWRRWWIYQTKRMMTETEASMPTLSSLHSFITIAQSPMPAVNTMSSMLYVFYGLTNGDLFTELQRGNHKGENKYWRNVKKYDLPLFKDLEQIQSLDTDDTIFKVFDYSPSNH